MSGKTGVNIQLEKTLNKNIYAEKTEAIYFSKGGGMKFYGN